jgi:hypothetical protein
MKAGFGRIAIQVFSRARAEWSPVSYFHLIRIWADPQEFEALKGSWIQYCLFKTKAHFSIFRDSFGQEKIKAQQKFLLGSVHSKDYLLLISAGKEEEEDGKKKKKKRAKRQKREPQEGDKPPGPPKGLLRPLPISDELSDFFGLGEKLLPRTEVVKRLWAYIKEHNLQVLVLYCLLCVKVLLRISAADLAVGPERRAERAMLERERAMWRGRGSGCQREGFGMGWCGQETDQRGSCVRWGLCWDLVCW